MRYNIFYFVGRNETFSKKFASMFVFDLFSGDGEVATQTISHF